jgi:hypothetical protein
MTRGVGVAKYRVFSPASPATPTKTKLFLSNRFHQSMETVFF